MPTSDSLFLFEVAAASMQSLVDSETSFHVKCHLPNYFTLKLKGPKDISKSTEKKNKVKQKLKTKKVFASKYPSGRAIIVADGEKLLSHLKGHELEISLWSIISPETKIGASPLPWSQVILNYLKQLKFEPPPAKITHEYYIYDDTMTKQVAIVKLNMKLVVLSKKRLDKRFTNIYKFYKPNRNFNRNEEKETAMNINEVDENTFVVNPSENTNIVRTEFSNNAACNAIKNANSSYILLKDKPLNNYVIPFKSKSYTSLTKKSRINTLRHVFGDYRGPYGDKVYCVGYVTVANDQGGNTTISESKSSKESPTSTTEPATIVADESKSSNSICNTENLDNLKLLNCKDVRCENRCFRPLPDKSDKPILLDITTIKKELCCVTGKMEIDKDPCSCTCKCTFGITKKTTYCGVCGGYEKAGEEFGHIPAGELPYPCPLYHKLIDKNKLKQIGSFNSSHYDSRGSSKGKGSKGSSRTSQRGSKGSDRSEKKKYSPESDKVRKRRDSKKSITRLSHSTPGSKKDDAGQKTDIESEKEMRKSKKKRDDRFKFNYGYQAPKIGHANCFDPCTGSLKPVPNHMGWLWTAGNIPGLKFRPHWRPGATHKNIVKMLRQAKYPNEIISKKKKKDPMSTKKKRPLKRPLLVVNKKNGEFSITMEQMKEYGGKNVRNIYQPPFEDKDPMTFTVGRTEEENRQRHKKKLREQRRLERAQRMFIQNTFQDLCHEICLKTYQQALGILPDAEKPECSCYPALPDPERVDMNVSCSCSENSSVISDTDSDEWIMEFTPPNCYYHQSSSPAAKKYPKTENQSQYTYLDYKVKILDKSGKEIPRFFIGPDGKQICSDLGGFKGPDGKWLQIGIDGYIGPDGRWAPHGFIGPNGETVDSEDGKFTTIDGETYTVGVDGYIVNGKWRFYAKSKVASNKSKYTNNKSKAIKGQDIKAQETKDKVRNGKDIKDKHGKGKDYTNNSTKAPDKQKDFTGKEKDKKAMKEKDNTKPSFEENGSRCDFSCFGTTSPRVLSEMGIRGHGQDRKLLLASLQKMLSKGIKVKLPDDPATRRRDRVGAQKTNYSTAIQHYYVERVKCKHPIPSPKGVMCCDEFGRKTYFKVKNPINTRPWERLANLHAQGKSVSSFHIPCYDSFLNSKALCHQLQQRSTMPYCQPNASGDQYACVT